MQTLLTRGVAITARFTQFRRVLDAEGLDGDTYQQFCRLAVDVSGFNDHIWSEIKHHFAALRPPYIAEATRDKSIRRRKPAIFKRQQGRCYFCEVELLPLDTPYKPSSEYIEARHAKDALYRDLWSDTDPNQRESLAERAEHWRTSEEVKRYRRLSQAETLRRQRIAHLEHLIPLSRGGSDDTDNLAIACEKCNLDKGIRTSAEFRRRPYDPISQLSRLCRMALTGLADAIQYESQNTYSFADACAELRALKIASGISYIEYKVLLDRLTQRNVSRTGGAD